MYQKMNNISTLRTSLKNSGRNTVFEANYFKAELIHRKAP